MRCSISLTGKTLSYDFSTIAFYVEVKIRFILSFRFFGGAGKNLICVYIYYLSKVHILLSRIRTQHTFTIHVL